MQCNPREESRLLSTKRKHEIVIADGILSWHSAIGASHAIMHITVAPGLREIISRLLKIAMKIARREALTVSFARLVCSQNISLSISLYIKYPL